ncbi:MAG TPA: M81 family metallopeptidase [Rhizomicrobium sp.]|jgi:microcystin degradation protein MlrC
MGNRAIRVFTAGVITETNTFAPWPTGKNGFVAFHGDATTRGKDDETGVLANVWKERARADGYTFVESVFAYAQPSGTTVQRVYEDFRDEILRDLKAKGPFNIVLLFLHGAMVSTECDDCEGDMLSRVREVVGPKAMIGAELDLHCHLTPLMIEKANAIVLMKEYPHTDYVERGHELYQILADGARDRCTPTTHLFDCRMVGFYPTTNEPMKSLVTKMKEAERRPKVLSVSFGHGFPWGDTPETGSKVLVVTDNDPTLAETVATEIGHAIYKLRHALLPQFPHIDAALDAAKKKDGLVVLADTADNAGGGAPSDNVSLLRAMLDAGVKDAVFGGIWDPVVAAALADAGVGARIPVRIGGKCGPASGDPMDVIATVRAIRADHDQQGLGPARSAMGLSVWAEIGGIDVVIMSTRTQIFAPDAFTGLGIDLTAKKTIALKSSWHFYALFSPLTENLIAVSTPGAIQMDFAAIDYRKKRDLEFFPRVDNPLRLNS